MIYFLLVVVGIRGRDIVNLESIWLDKNLCSSGFYIISVKV